MQVCDNCESKRKILAQSSSRFDYGITFRCGLVSGVAQAGAFNPWDRALYLSLKHYRPFLRLENFVKPYEGFLQTVTQRVISGGLYFPLEDIFRHSLGDSAFSRAWVNFLAGNMAGAMNGLFLNPASAVKYHYWGSDRENFRQTAIHMYKTGGVRPFLLGSSATITRDLVFGGVFAVMRHSLPHKQQSPWFHFFMNMIAACAATLMSSPWNYVRNVQYAVPPGTKHPTAAQALRELLSEAKAKGSTAGALKHLQERLRLGWGTARVAVGMAFGAQVYRACCDMSGGVEK